MNRFVAINRSKGDGVTAGMFTMSSARIITAFVAVTVIGACGGSAAGSYFDTAGPILDSHSRTMTDAEAAMFDATSTGNGAVFAFGGDISTAVTLLPIFRDTAAAIEGDIAEWDRLDVAGISEAATEHHSLIREAMSLRLDAMRDGGNALEEIAGGQISDEVRTMLVDAETAMSEANLRIKTALDRVDLVED
ncbi:MAG: hypothetical protein QF554_05340 [Dehalococcoidia bacterium]|nr:hypothetical protein [Dehalococcoidia bacterium]